MSVHCVSNRMKQRHHQSTQKIQPNMCSFAIAIATAVGANVNAIRTHTPIPSRDISNSKAEFTKVDALYGNLQYK